MPNRPTKEFWKKHYPKIKKQYEAKGEDGETAKKVTANIWHHQMGAKAKKKYEKIRAKRESGPHSPTTWGTAEIGLQNLIK